MEAFSILFEYLEPMMMAQAFNCIPEATKRTRRTIGAKRLVLGIILLAPITMIETLRFTDERQLDIEGWGSPQAAALQTASLQLQLEEEEKGEEKEEEEKEEE